MCRQPWGPPGLSTALVVHGQVYNHAVVLYRSSRDKHTVKLPNFVTALDMYATKARMRHSHHHLCLPPALPPSLPPSSASSDGLRKLARQGHTCASSLALSLCRSLFISILFFYVCLCLPLSVCVFLSPSLFLRPFKQLAEHYKMLLTVPRFLEQSIICGILFPLSSSFFQGLF